MKLKNKKIGEVVDVQLGNYGDPSDSIVVVYSKDGGKTRLPQHQYKSLKEFFEEWEDYAEPEEHWYIDCDGEVICPSEALCTSAQRDMERIGNCFKTKKEAELAVKKLQAWKRLKDKGFEFDGDGFGTNQIHYRYDCDWALIAEDFNLLFGGEE